MERKQVEWKIQGEKSNRKSEGKKWDRKSKETEILQKV